tara:strand:- start:396 stop:752 length:357 start_codon:yes stop_codon:yes gene_type:complete
MSVPTGFSYKGDAMGIYDYDKHAKPKMSKVERDKLMKKFLEKGGKIQKLQPGAAAVLGALDKSKIPHWDNDDVKKGKAHGTAPLPEYKNTKPNTYHDYDLGGDNIPVYVPTKKEGGNK